MSRRILAVIVSLLITAFSTPLHAVLKEANLDQTLKVLRTELTQNYIEQQRRSNTSKMRNEQARQTLFETVKKSNQNALMLYSQQYDYIFDLTYACNEATNLWQEFQRNSMPFDKIIQMHETEIERYDGLISSLQDMPTILLSDEERMNRSVCLTLATAIKRQLENSLTGYKDDIESNNHVKERLQSQHEYAKKRYDALQRNIFINGDNSYITILKNLPMQFRMASHSLQSKYVKRSDVKSQWSGNFIIGLFIFIIFYAIIASIINIGLIRIIMPILARRKWLPETLTSDEFIKKRSCIIMASTVITFAIIVAIVTAMLSQNFIIMASGLLVEYAWLLGVILVSLLIRLNGDQIKSGFKVYMPITVMGAIIIIIRIILVPSSVVSLIFPPILIIFALWQWQNLRKLESNLKREDKTYSWITLLIFAFAVVSSWIGYTLLAVQAIIWWIMQLTCILTITFIYKLLVSYGKRHFGPNAPITRTWFYGFIKTVILPVLGVVSVLISIYWAASVFELTDICKAIFTTNFINAKNLHVNLLHLIQIIALYFLFKYLVNVAKRILQLHYDKKDSKGMERNKAVMGTNALKILVWGVYIVIIMNLLGVGNTWLTVVCGGLATGVGFASKDILENIYYGISLMAGRIHIGDMIEIDGIRGKVEDMNYTSTMVEATDGSVIAFQNSQLFTKNYKNLTKNHGWELILLPIGVAYGTNIHECKKIIVDAVNNLIEEMEKDNRPVIDKARGVSVIFVDFGESSIDLKVICWGRVTESIFAKSRLREVIYDALNANNITIPFPQLDVNLNK